VPSELCRTSSSACRQPPLPTASPPLWARSLAIKGIGLSAPAVLVVSFLPMLCIALGYYYMNRADPDCGTTFAWVTRAMGPQLGWLNGWVIVAADIVVMASLSQIAGTYTFLLFGAHTLADSTPAVTVVGVGWIVGMVAICIVGVELNAKTQAVLLGPEVTILTAFAIVSFVKGASTHPPGYVAPALAWIDPFQIPSFNALINGVLLGLFIYWAGMPASRSTRSHELGLGAGPLSGHQHASVGGRVRGRLLCGPVLRRPTVPGQQLERCPQRARRQDVRVGLGQAADPGRADLGLGLDADHDSSDRPHDAFDGSLGRDPEGIRQGAPRFQTPWVSTISFGVVSIGWFVGLEILSKHVLVDSVTGLGFLIAFYYGFTGLACTIYYRRTLLRSLKNFIFAGILPLLGFLSLSFVFVRAYMNYSQSGAAASPPLLGIQIPIVIGIGSVLLGLLLVIPSFAAYRGGYFRRRPEAATANALELRPGGQPHLSSDDVPSHHETTRRSR